MYTNFWRPGKDRGVQYYRQCDRKRLNEIMHDDKTKVTSATQADARLIRVRPLVN